MPKRPQFRSGPKPALVTIPGARSKSSWQDLVQTVMGPHFHCERYSYRDYDRFSGLLAIMVHPWWALAAIAVLVAGLAFRWPTSLYPWPQYLLPTCSIVFAAIAVHRARTDRAHCAQQFARWLADLGPKPPSVIADSFGSYLVATALKDHAETKVQNLIVASAPLPRQYPWVPVVSEKALRVRSEIAAADLLTRLLYFAPWFAEDLGDAGSRGFSDNRIVHTARADGMCLDCEVQSAPAPVHNVRLSSRRGHQFLNRLYLQEYCLPFLWNIPIPEFAEMTRVAREAVDLERAHEPEQEEAVLVKFLACKFSWTSGLTVQDWMASTIDGYAEKKLLRSDREEMLRFVKYNFLGVIEAAEKESSGSGSRDDDMISCLHPRVALTKLILTSLQRP
jgi:pimeloyl-ACP methyl ester carboxylesterase